MGYVPGGRPLVVGGDDGYLALVDPRRGTLVKRLRGHRGTRDAPAFSADGRLMATTSFSDPGAALDPAVRSTGRPTAALLHQP